MNSFFIIVIFVVVLANFIYSIFLKPEKTQKEIEDDYKENWHP